MTRPALLLGLVGAVLVVLAGCEDNEHPFGDSWSIACESPDAPTMTAVFTEPRRLDDVGKRREYLGRVEVAGPDFPDVWLWQVEVDLRDRSAATVALEHVPVPDEYVTGEPGFRDLDLDVRTYEEHADTTAAFMTGECAWGEGSGDLRLDQADDCDLCFDCDTGGSPTTAGAFAPLLLLLLRRRRGDSATA